MKKNIREILISFSITLIILGGISVLCLTHYRIQNTTFASDYTFLELYRYEENQLEVLFDNAIYIVDLTEINELFEVLSTLEIFVPASIQVIVNIMDTLIESLTQYILLYGGNF